MLAANIFSKVLLSGAALPNFGRDSKGGDTCFFAHLISFLAIFHQFFALCHRILPIVSPVFEICKTLGMAIAIPAILVSPPLIVNHLKM